MRQKSEKRSSKQMTQFKLALATGPPASASSTFDPAAFEETRRPLDEASSLPGRCYSSEAWYQRELERAFLPSWTLMGREVRYIVALVLHRGLF